MAKSGKRGASRLLSATRFSAAGLRAAWRHEAAFRQEVVVTVVLLPVAFWLGETALQRSLLIGSCILVLIVELLNSAVEAAIDRIGHDHHELSAQAKDMGSAAVLLALALACISWGSVAWARFA